MINFISQDNFNDIKSEMDCFNSILYKNDDTISDIGLTQPYEFLFTSNNLPLSSNQENTKTIYELPNKTFENKETEKNQKEEEKPTQKKTKEKINATQLSSSKKLGRKTKASNETGEHNKFTDDNLIRRIKSQIFKLLLHFINESIKDPHLKLKNISGKVSKESKADYNRELLNKPIKSIFSSNISEKFRKPKKDFNKNVIEKLLNDEDIEKRIFYETLFNLTFLDCIKHIRGDIFIKELSGLKTLDELVEGLEKNDDYKIKFFDYVKNYEKIIEQKKVRKREKKNL